MTNEITNYINFKLGQHVRITGFDHKQANAKEKLSAILKANLEAWTKEAIQAGV